MSECTIHRPGKWWYVRGPADVVVPGARVEAAIPRTNTTRLVTIARVRQIEDGMALGYPPVPRCEGKGGKCSLPHAHKGWCK